MNIFKNEEMRQIDGFLYEVNKDADYKTIQRVVGYFFSILFIVFSLFYTCENDLMYALFYYSIVLYYFGELFLTNGNKTVFHKGITQQKQLNLLKINRVSQLILLTPFNYKNYIKLRLLDTLKIEICVMGIYLISICYIALVSNVTIYPGKIIIVLIPQIVILISEFIDCYLCWKL